MIKGDTNLLCRLQDAARATNDLDLFRNGAGAAMDAARLLVQQMDGARIGQYNYRLAEPAQSPKRADSPVDVAQVGVQVFYGDQLIGAFPIDVAGAVPLHSEPTRHIFPASKATIPGFPHEISFSLYPVENQLADKMCAVPRQAGQPPTTASCRRFPEPTRPSPATRPQ